MDTFEARILFRSKKSYLVEMTLGGKYFVPYSCITYMGEPDIDGNIVFEVNPWFAAKLSRGEFAADE